MLEFEFLDETLDINSTTSYYLSIQASPDGLVFSILDTVRKKYVGLRSYVLTENPDKIIDHEWYREVLKKDDLLQQKYKGAGLIYTDMRASLVPDPLFKKEAATEFARLNFILGENEEIRYNKLEKNDSWTVFPVPAKLAELFSEEIPGLLIFHHSVPFLNRVLSEGEKTGSLVTHLNFHSSFFEIAVSNSGKLLLYNSFEYKSTNDVLYYTLNIYKQFKFPPSKGRVILSGKITKQSSLYENLRRYLRKPVFAEQDKAYTYSYTFEKLPPHSNFNLLNLYPCTL